MRLLNAVKTWRAWSLLVGVGAILGVGLLATLGGAQGERGTGLTVAETNADCLQCHGGSGFVVRDPEKDTTRSLYVDGAAFARSVHRDAACLDCHPGAEKLPHVLAEMTLPNCADCHSDVNEEFAISVHALSDSPTAGKPTCISCHGGNPHTIASLTGVPRKDKLALCFDCHSDSKLMAAHGATTDAAMSYTRSFHGKAISYGSDKTAVCSDCHGYHAVFSPSDPRSPVQPKKVTQVCAKCHPGAPSAFAVSGANHLDLKIEQSPVLRAEVGFFTVLTWSVLAALFLSVILDARVGIRLAWRRFRQSLTKGEAAQAQERTYLWFTPWQRIQHWIFAASFFLLVGTGLPLRFPEVGWLRSLYGLLGGLQSARLIHRGAGIVMIAMFVVHIVYLLWTWKRINYSIRRIPMLPNRRDLTDFIETARFYLGLREDPPKFGRFSFRAKFGYWAVFWGLPIMAFSGLVLWYPVHLGGRLGELGFAIAYIAHSDEAVLAAGAIIVWHIYTTLLSPLYTPFAAKMIIGRITEEELRREHDHA